jgi:hypothetical protein
MPDSENRYTVIPGLGTLYGYLLAALMGVVMIDLFTWSASANIRIGGMILGALLGLFEYSLTAGQARITVELDFVTPMMQTARCAGQINRAGTGVANLWRNIRRRCQRSNSSRVRPSPS